MLSPNPSYNVITVINSKNLPLYRLSIPDIFLSRWQIDSIPQSQGAPAKQAGLSDFTFLSWQQQRSLLMFTTSADTQKTNTRQRLALPSQPLVTTNQGQPKRPGSSHHLFGLVDIWPQPTLKSHFRGGRRHIALCFSYCIWRGLISAVFHLKGN